MKKVIAIQIGMLARNTNLNIEISKEMEEFPYMSFTILDDELGLRKILLSCEANGHIYVYELFEDVEDVDEIYTEGATTIRFIELDDDEVKNVNDNKAERIYYELRSGLRKLRKVDYYGEYGLVCVRR